MTTLQTPFLPRTWRGRLQLLTAALLVVLAFAGTAAARVHAAAAGSFPLTDAAVAEVDGTPAPAAPDASEPAAAGPADTDAGFTLGDLTAGRVPQDVQDRFWQRQLDAILAAPCPATTAGATTVTLFLGADEAWTARLEAAVAEHRAACGA